MRLGRAEAHSRRLVARVGSFLIHRHHAVAADGRPPALRDIFEPWISYCIADRGRRRRGYSRYRIEELPIYKHLRPDARIDNISTVLKELPIDVLGDRCACLRNIDSGCNRRALGQGCRGWKTEAEKKQPLKEENPFPRNVCQ